VLKKKIITVIMSAMMTVGLTAVCQFTYAQTGLKDVYANQFLFGSILNNGSNKGNTMQDDQTKEIILREFNSITPENELKPDATMLQAGSTDDDIKVSLNRASSILNFCRDNNIGVRGHALVWHNQTGNWFFNADMSNNSDNGPFATKEVMNRRMESYIKNLFAAFETQYPTLNLYAYDVVNEAFENWGGQLRPAHPTDHIGGNSKWMRIYGDDEFIVKAFEYARKYAPAKCKLFYNDYNEYAPAKTDAIVAVANKIKAQENIDGIGMQAHLGIGGSYDGGTASQFETALAKFVGTGLEVQVTELDVSMGNTSDLAGQAVRYRDIMRAILKYKENITAVVVWGVKDNHSWRDQYVPLLFNAQGQKKPAYDSLFKLIPESDWGDGSNPGIPSGHFIVTANVSPAIGGTVDRSPNTAYYAANSTVTLTPSANDNWRFDSWDGEIGSAVPNADGSISIQVTDKNLVITAKFVPTLDGTENLIKDGNFSGTTLGSDWSWNTGEHYGNSTGNNSVSNGKVTLTITTPGAESYQPQLIQQSISLEQGMNYVLTFKASASAAREMEVNFQQSTSPWGPHTNFDLISLTTAEQEYTFEFKMDNPSDQNVQLSFNVGGPGTAGTSVTISDVKLVYLASTRINHKSIAAANSKSAMRVTTNKSSISIKFNAANTGETTLKLYNLKGDVISTAKVKTAAGKSYSHTFKQKKLPNGSYIVRMQNGNVVEQSRIMVSK